MDRLKYVLLLMFLTLSLNAGTFTVTTNSETKTYDVNASRTENIVVVFDLDWTSGDDLNISSSGFMDGELYGYVQDTDDTNITTSPQTLPYQKWSVYWNWSGDLNSSNYSTVTTKNQNRTGNGDDIVNAPSGWADSTVSDSGASTIRVVIVLDKQENVKPLAHYIGSSGQLSETKGFSKQMFLDNYYDYDGDPLHSVKFVSLRGLADDGELQLNGTTISMGDDVAVDDLDNVKLVVTTPKEWGSYEGDDIEWQAFDGTDYSNGVSLVRVELVPPNTPPVFSDLNNTTAIKYVQNTDAIAFDTDVSVADAELDARSNGDGDWGVPDAAPSSWSAGSSTVELTITRWDFDNDVNATNSVDIFDINDTDKTFTKNWNGTSLQVGFTDYATYSSTDGVFTMKFNNVPGWGSSGASTQLVNEIVKSITYRASTVSSNGTHKFRWKITDHAGLYDIGYTLVELEGDGEPPVDKVVDVSGSSKTFDWQQLFFNMNFAAGAVTASLNSSSPHTQGTITIDGEDITYTANSGANGKDIIIIDIKNSTGTLNETKTIKLINISTSSGGNTPPTANNFTYSTNIGSDADTFSWKSLGSASDLDNDTLTASQKTAPSKGSISVSGDDVTYTPASNKTGTDTFELTIDDGNGGTVDITVTVNGIDTMPVNTPPTANDFTYGTSIGSSAKTFSWKTLGSASDVDGDTLIATEKTTPSKGSISVNGADVTYAPASNKTGTDTFELTIDDGNGGTVDITVTVNGIDTMPVNTPPTANDFTYGTAIGNSTKKFSWLSLGNASDKDNDKLTAKLVNNPSQGTATISGEDIVYTPNNSVVGSDVFDVEISDGEDSVTIRVTVNGIDTVTTALKANNPPKANDFIYPKPIENSGKTFSWLSLGNASDKDNDKLNATVEVNPSKGTVTVAGDNVRYEPNANQIGSDSFKLSISDGIENTVITVTVKDIDTKTVAVKTNHAPVANDFVYPVKVGDTHKTFGWLKFSSASDEDGDVLTATLKTNPLKGSVTVDGENVRYTPNVSLTNENDTFELTISDGALTTDITVIVNGINTQNQLPENNSPIAQDFVYQTPIGNSAKTFSWLDLGNASDKDDDILSAKLKTNPIKGDVAVDGNNLRYTPKTGMTGIDMFQLTISDGEDSVDIYVTVQDIDTKRGVAKNKVPTANDFTYNTDISNSAKTFSWLTLGNAKDEDNDELSAKLKTSASKGSVLVDGDNIRYIPKANQTGNDTFELTISDGLDSVDINVTVKGIASNATVAVNTAPTASDFSYGSIGNSSKTFNWIDESSANDSDGDVLNAKLKTNPSKGSVIIIDNNLTYSPKDSVSGDDSFKVTISDGLESVEITVTVTGIDTTNLPTANDFTYGKPIGNSGKTFSWLSLGSANDKDGDTLTATQKTAPNKGSIAVDGDNVRYTPNDNESGTDTFELTISDGVSTVDIIVTVNGIDTSAGVAVNNPPVANDFTYSKPIENSGKTFSWKSLGSASDKDNDLLSAIVKTNPSKGSVTVDGSNLRYTPNNNQTGSDNFDLTISDGVADVDITVTVNGIDTQTAPVAVNNPPVANDFVYPKPIGNSGKTFSWLNFGGASDKDEDKLSAKLKTKPSRGSFVIDGDNIRYMPNENEFGDDVFEITISDGLASTDIKIGVKGIDTKYQDIAVNNPPVANDFTYQKPIENSGKTFNWLSLGSASDKDNDVVSAVLKNQPAKGSVIVNGSNLRYTPKDNQTGSDNFDLTISDGLESVDITVTVNGIDTASVPVAANNPPVASSFTYKEPIGNSHKSFSWVDFSNASDKDGDDLNAKLNSDPALGKVAINGKSLRYTPKDNVSGMDSFKLLIDDGLDAVEITVSVTGIDTSAGIAINNPPVASDFEYSKPIVNSSKTFSWQNLGSASDKDNDVLSATLKTNPSKGSVVVDGQNLRYSPKSDVSGEDSFKLTIDDGLENTEITVTVKGIDTTSVQVAVNNPPRAEDFTYAKDIGNIAKVFSWESLSNAIDKDNDLLSAKLKTNPSKGIVTVVGNNLRYTPKANVSGDDSFELTISDGELTTDITVTVNGIDTNTVALVSNSTPIANDFVYQTMISNNAQNMNWFDLSSASDKDNDLLKAVLKDAPNKGSVVINNNSLRYTPKSDLAGSDSFELTISDGELTTDITVTVNGIDTISNNVSKNIAPTAKDFVYIDDISNSAKNMNWIKLAIASDADGDDLSAKLKSLPTKGSVVVNGSMLRYTPKDNISGSDEFNLTISDGLESVDITVTVNGIDTSAGIATNNAPTANDFTYATAIVNSAKTFKWIDPSSASDIDGDILTATLKTVPSKGKVTVDADILRYTPNSSQFGDDSFELTISDGLEETDITVTVNGINTKGSKVVKNRPPTANDFLYGIAITDSTAIFSWLTLGKAEDADSDILSATLKTNPAKGDVVIDGENIVYTPSGVLDGMDAFIITISDKLESIDITVMVKGAKDSVNDAVNNAPIASDFVYPIAIGETYKTFSWFTLGKVSDEYEDDVKASLTLAPKKGKVTIDELGLTYTPTGYDENGNSISDNKPFGKDTFILEVDDSRGGKVALNITVLDVNIKQVEEELKSVEIIFYDLDFDDFRNANITPKNITTDLDLISTLASDSSVDVSWKSSNEAVISPDGVVTQDSVNKLVTMTATITKGEYKKTKKFLLTVPKFGQTDNDILNDDKTSLTFFDIRENNFLPSQIRSDLNLIINGQNGSQIDWSSSDSSIIDINGIVTRDTVDRDVDLIATISFNGQTITKDFNLTVLKQPASDEQVVANVKDEIEVKSILNKNRSFLEVISDLNLFDTLNGLDVSWESSNIDSVEVDGTVHRKYVDVPVTLTATFSKLGVAQTKKVVYDVIVKSIEQESIDAIVKDEVVVFNDMNVSIVNNEKRRVMEFLDENNNSISSMIIVDTVHPEDITQTDTGFVSIIDVEENTNSSIKDGEVIQNLNGTLEGVFNVVDQNDSEESSIKISTLITNSKLYFDINGTANLSSEVNNTVVKANIIKTGFVEHVVTKDNQITKATSKIKDTSIVIEEDGSVTTTSMTKDDSNATVVLEVKGNNDGTAEHIVKLQEGLISSVKVEQIGGQTVIEEDGDVSTTLTTQKASDDCTGNWEAVAISQADGTTKTQFRTVGINGATCNELSPTLVDEESYEAGLEVEIKELDDGLIHIQTTTAPSSLGKVFTIH
jgi:ribosomal protein S9